MLFYIFTGLVVLAVHYQAQAVINVNAMNMETNRKEFATRSLAHVSAGTTRKENPVRNVNKAIMVILATVVCASMSVPPEEYFLDHNLRGWAVGELLIRGSQLGRGHQSHLLRNVFG
jgi:hypothetical protein